MEIQGNIKKAEEIAVKWRAKGLPYNAIYDSCLEMAQWKDEQAKQLHKIIIKLWDMLDWIDTYADLKINGSENDVYFGEIEDKTRERFAFVKSDGYDLFINDERITNNEHNTTKTY